MTVFDASHLQGKEMLWCHLKGINVMSNHGGRGDWWKITCHSIWCDFGIVEKAMYLETKWPLEWLNGDKAKLTLHQQKTKKDNDLNP